MDEKLSTETEQQIKGTSVPEVTYAGSRSEDCQTDSNVRVTDTKVVDNDINECNIDTIAKKSKRLHAKMTALKVSKIAIFSALTFVLYLLNFPLAGIFPAFLELNFSDVPLLIGGFALGPVSGSIIVVMRMLFKLPLTTTAGVGELSDLIIGLSLVLPSSIIYKKNRTVKGALIGMLSGGALSVAASLIINRFLIIPFYVKLFFSGNWEPLLSMCRVVLKNINRENFYTLYLWGAVLPFNLLRWAVSGALSFVLYKRVSRLIAKW